MRRLAIGDIHGGYRSLLDVLEKAKFNPKKDLLIGVGDYVDGYSQTYEVIEYLRNLPNFKGCLGNHDAFYLEWANHPDISPQPIWTNQGGLATLKSYNYKVNETHRDWLNSLPYYIELDDMLFIHGGYDPTIPINEQAADVLMWDRTLIRDRLYDYLMGNEGDSIAPYKKVIVGHTQTNAFPYFMNNWVWPDQKEIDMTKPFHHDGVWDIDTGAGWQERLTVMDVDTEEYWQSETTGILYPNEQRN